MIVDSYFIIHFHQTVTKKHRTHQHGQMVCYSSTVLVIEEQCLDLPYCRVQNVQDWFFSCYSRAFLKHHASSSTIMHAIFISFAWKSHQHSFKTRFSWWTACMNPVTSHAHLHSAWDIIVISSMSILKWQKKATHICQGVISFHASAWWLNQIFCAAWDCGCWCTTFEFTPVAVSTFVRKSRSSFNCKKCHDREFLSLTVNVCFFEVTMM